MYCVYVLCVCIVCMYCVCLLCVPVYACVCASCQRSTTPRRRQTGSAKAACCEADNRVCSVCVYVLCVCLSVCVPVFVRHVNVQQHHEAADRQHRSCVLWGRQPCMYCVCVFIVCVYLLCVCLSVCVCIMSMLSSTTQAADRQRICWLSISIRACNSLPCAPCCDKLCVPHAPYCNILCVSHAPYCDILCVPNAPYCDILCVSHAQPSTNWVCEVPCTL